MVYFRKYLDDDFSDVKNIVDDAFGISISKVISTNNSFSLVAVSNDRVVGHVRVDILYDTFRMQHYFVLGYFCVDKDFRRLGIGRGMMDEVIKLGVENDISYIELTSSSEKEGANIFYKSCGFKMRDTNVFRRDL